MKRYDKLIFVDKQNTDVSPMAEAIMQSRFLLEDILIESRGLVVLFPEPVNPKTQEILAAAGIPLQDHISSPLEEKDFDDRTLILAMEEGHKEKIFSDFEQPVNVFTLREYTGFDDDVMNPYGGSLEDYQHCFEQMGKMMDRLSEILIQEEN